MNSRFAYFLAVVFAVFVRLWTL